MARHPSYQADPTPSLFQAAQRPGVASSQFWISMLAYRPVLLVGGVWLLLICLAAVAYSRLMFTGRPPEPVTELPATPRLATEAESQRDQIHFQGPVADDQRMTPAQEAGTAGSDGTPATDLGLTGAATAEGSEAGSEAALVPAWSLFGLVGLCALGCMGISHRARAPQRPRPARPSRKPARKRGPTSKSQRPAAKPPRSPERLRPYSPERDGQLVPGRPQVADTPASLEVARPSIRPAPQPAPQVTLLSQQEHHPLDWTDGSLADSLDLRQRRSLSSLL